MPQKRRGATPHKRNQGLRCAEEKATKQLYTKDKDRFDQLPVHGGGSKSSPKYQNEDTTAPVSQYILEHMVPGVIGGLTGEETEHPEDISAKLAGWNSEAVQRVADNVE